MKKIATLIFVLCFFSLLNGLEIDELKCLEQSATPFNYPLNVKVLPAINPCDEIVLCCHGYGGNSSLVEIIKSYQIANCHLVGFNFPDYDFFNRGACVNTSSFGTIQELLPALHLLKKIVVDSKADKVSLYGFSAGGGAVVNIIAVLNTTRYDAHLMEIGIDSSSKQKILNAIQRGVVLLDSPLKSMEEIVEAVQSTSENQYYVHQYSKNGFRPIESLNKWKGLKLNVILFFQNPDEAVANRDDQLFYERILQNNPHGQNLMITQDEGGHNGFHHSLWKAYQRLQK